MSAAALSTMVDKKTRRGQADILALRRAITDIVGLSSQNNVTGTINDAGGTNPLRATELAAPLNNLPRFISALYNSPHSTRWFVLMFGVDSTLQVGPGWDEATGLGSPNGWDFVQAVAGNGENEQH